MISNQKGTNLNWFISSLSLLLLSFAYLIVSPPNSGPDEIMHARTAWYVSKNPSAIALKTFIVTEELPGALVIPNATHSFDHTACFTQRKDIPASCQNLSRQLKQTQTFYIYFHSVPYYIFIGTFQHMLAEHINPFLTAKITSFVLCWIILFISFFRLRKVLPSFDPVSLFFLVSSSSLFLFGVVNPSSFEIVSAIYFAISIVSVWKSNSPRNSLHFYVSGLFLTLSRPLGFVWILCMILYCQIFQKNIGKLVKVNQLFLRSLIFLVPFFLFQIWLGYDWPSPLRIPRPTIVFYLEEAVREFNESGQWYAHLFGILGAGEIQLPTLFVYLNVVSTVFILKFFASSNRLEKNRQYAVIVVCIFFVPAALQLVNSATWPVWWQGRYLIPVFVGLLILHLAQFHREGGMDSFSRWGALLAIITHGYLAVITFARFNWGLYDTTTPIIANGWSANILLTSIFAICFCVFLLGAYKTLNAKRFLISVSKLLIDIIPKKRSLP